MFLGGAWSGLYSNRLVIFCSGFSDRQYNNGYIHCNKGIFNFYSLEQGIYSLEPFHSLCPILGVMDKCVHCTVQSIACRN